MMLRNKLRLSKGVGENKKRVKLGRQTLKTSPTTPRVNLGGMTEDARYLVTYGERSAGGVADQGKRGTSSIRARQGHGRGHGRDQVSGEGTRQVQS